MSAARKLGKRAVPCAESRASSAARLGDRFPEGPPPQRLVLVDRQKFPHRRAQILKICASIGCRVTRTVLIGPVPVDPSTSETVTPLRVLTGAGAVGADLLL
jgi:hypothetical protein